MRRAIAALLVCSVHLAYAGPHQVLVLKAEGNADSGSRTSVDGHVMRLAKNLDGKVEAGDITLTEAAAVVGCKLSEPSCKDEVLTTLGVDEVVGTTVTTTPGGLNVTVRRYTKGAAPRSAQTTLQSGKPADAKMNAEIGPLFGVGAAAAPAPTADKTRKEPARKEPAPSTADKTPRKEPAASDKRATTTAAPPSSDKRATTTVAASAGSDKTPRKEPAPATTPPPTTTAAPTTAAPTSTVPTTATTTTATPTTVTPTTTAPPPTVADTSTQPISNEPTAPPPATTPEGEAPSRRGPVIGMVVGGGLVVLGVVMWAQAANVQGQIDNAPVGRPVDFKSLRDLESQGDAFATIGNVCFGVGLIVGGVSTYLFFHNRNRAPRAALAPTVFPHGAGVSLTIGGGL